VQRLFSEHRPTTVLPTEVTETVAPEPVGGGVGLGTWVTQAEYKDLRVTQGDKVLLATDPAKGLEGWRKVGGDWQAVDGAWRQKSNADNAWMWTGDKTWRDYTLTVKARKLVGAEGFLVPFAVQDDQNFTWWNLGGWGNQRTAIEHCRGGGKRELGSVPVRIETGRWYDIRIELRGDKVDCWLDGKKLQSATLGGPRRTFFSTVGFDAKANEFIVKLVNPTDAAVSAGVKLDGGMPVGPQAKVFTLTSAKPTDENSLAEPLKVAPVASTAPVAGPRFDYTVPPYALVILRVPAR
jgi:alpha-L-arabinofuranosidase